MSRLLGHLLMSNADNNGAVVPPTMPPKRGPPASSIASSKKAKTGQASISSFFSPPRKAAQIGNAKGKSRQREPSVISISDSDDDVIAVDQPHAPFNSKELESDEAMARRLAREWAQADGVHEAGDGEVEVVLATDEATEAKMEMNIKSNSPAPPPTPPVKVHPLFAGSDTKPKTPNKPLLSPTKPLAQHNAQAGPSRLAPLGRADPAPAIDFDIDSLLFRPEEVDVSRWPKGRLPYSVLVGVYVQVASTRSRLTIVRVLTK